MVDQERKRLWNTYVYSEASTGLGKVVRFTAGADDVAKIKEVLELVRSIDVPRNH